VFELKPGERCVEGIAERRCGGGVEDAFRRRGFLRVKKGGTSCEKESPARGNTAGRAAVCSKRRRSYHPN
jgi:hypothetical protein